MRFSTVIGGRDSSEAAREDAAGHSLLTAAEAGQLQAGYLGHASRATREAIERGDFPQWEQCVQVMDDSGHPS